MLGKYFKQQSKLYGLTLVFLLLVDLAQFVIPLVLKEVIDALERQPEWMELFWGGLAIAFLGVGVFGFRAAWRMFLARAAHRLYTDIRADLYRKLCAYPQSFHAKARIGDLMARATNDLNAVRAMFSFGVVSIFDLVFMGTASIWFMLSLNARLTGLVVLPLLVLVPVVHLFENRIHRAFRRVQELFSEISSLTQELFTGILVVKAFHCEKRLTERFAAKNREYVGQNLKLARLSAMFDPLLSLPVAISTIIALYAGGRAVMQGGFTIGGLVAFTAYLGMLSWPVMALAFAINLYQRGMASLKRIEEITKAHLGQQEGFTAFGVQADRAQRRSEGESLDRTAVTTPPIHGATAPTASPDHPTASRPSIDPNIAATRLPDDGKVDLEFTKLNFYYDPGREVLRDLDLAIPAGQKVGVLGRIGSGKSTLHRVLTRSFPVQDGSVRLNGTDLNRYGEAALRELITVVPQEPFLFSATISENIAFFNRQIGQAEIAQAAFLADLDATIREMPAGYDTLLGERGVNLSGGQKQRVTIARALLKPAPVLVFDDCFSAMDIETEHTILNRLEPVMARCTVLLITHRVSAVQNLDRIIVLQEGRVVEDGTHQELLRLGGRYAAMWRRHALEQRLMEHA
ncbi:MAG: ABC transporter ATP-binding protein [Bradymonadales bacterium]|nr:ABC transporter ATP-binding protein [Bradymonadales bacterium]